MKTCSICKQRFAEFGNNPDPFHHENGEVCCNDCDYRYVVPARIMPNVGNNPALLEIIAGMAQLGASIIATTRALKAGDLLSNPDHQS